MLNEEQVEAYRENGYLKVEGLFSCEEVEELEGEMNWISRCRTTKSWPAGSSGAPQNPS